MKRTWKLLLLAALSACTFLLFINGPDIVISHEARVAQPARLMAASGWPWSAQLASVPATTLRPGLVRLEPDYSAPPVQVNPWLVPVLNGRIRLQKPPLPYWCSAVLLKLTAASGDADSTKGVERAFDLHGQFLVRFIPALMGAIGTFLLFDLARRLFGNAVAWCTALAWVSTYAACEMYRKAMADPYLAFFALLCVWTWIVAHGDDQKRSSRAWLVASYAALALALLAKGPPAIVAILFPLAAYHLCFGARLRMDIRGHLIGLGLLLLIAAPWPLYVLKNVPHAMDVWRYESVGELTDNLENARQWWFYVPQLFYLSMPWTPLWVVGCILPFTLWRESRSAPSQDNRLAPFFPLIWWAAAVVFFSFLNQKKNAYLLPALPAQAMMIGQALAALLGWVRETRFKGGAGAMVSAQAAIGIGFTIALTVLLQRASGLSATVLIVASIAMLLAIVPVVAIVRRSPKAWIVSQAITYTALVVLTWRWFITPMDDARSPRPVAREMMDLCRDPQYTILVPRLPEEVAVYLPIDIKYGFGTRVLVVVDDTHGVHERSIKLTPIPEPRIESFQAIVPGAKVMSVRRLEIKDLPSDYRWKLYELLVQRRGFARADQSSFSTTDGGFVGSAPRTAER